MGDGVALKKQKTDGGGKNADLGRGEDPLNPLDIQDTERSSAVRLPDATVSLDNSSDAKYLQVKKLPSTQLQHHEVGTQVMEKKSGKPKKAPEASQ